MKSIRFVLMAAALVAPLAASAQWAEVAVDQFDGTAPLAFSALAVSTGNLSDADFTSNLDYSALAFTPTPAVPSGGDGKFARLSANNVTGAAQFAYRTLDVSSLVSSGNDYAVEALTMPYAATANTATSTTFGGIGIRMNANFTEGYFAECRTDNSPSFGSYINAYKVSGGLLDYLGRIYFQVGSNGQQADFDAGTGNLGQFGNNAIVRDPQAGARNTFYTLRLEAEGAVIRWIVDGQVAIEFTDASPIASGRAALYHSDPFNSVTTPAQSAATVYEYVKIFEKVASNANDAWTLYE